MTIDDNWTYLTHCVVWRAIGGILQFQTDFTIQVLTHDETNVAKQMWDNYDFVTFPEPDLRHFG